MERAAITLEELIQDNADSTELWRAWFAGHADALALPCDIFDSKTVAGLVRHIFLAELRHSQRLTGQRVVTADEVPAATADDSFATHDQASRITAVSFHEPLINRFRKSSIFKRSARAPSEPRVASCLCMSCSTRSAIGRSWPRFCVSAPRRRIGRTTSCSLPRWSNGDRILWRRSGFLSSIA
jgi:hypothetical protein